MMPGLFTAFYRDPDAASGVEALLAGRADRSARRLTRYALPGVTVAQLARSPLGHSFYQHPDGIQAWVYGAVFSRVAGMPAAEPPDRFARLICELYLKFDLNFVAQVNGEFNLVLYDPRASRLVIANDRYALRPWYWTENAGGIFLAPALNDLIPLLPGGPEIDREIMLGFMAFNKMRLGDRTMIRQVGVLPAAALWQIDLASGEIARRTYWQFRYNDALSAEGYSPERVGEIVDCYRQAMNQRALSWPEARVGISLSGGLDSRTMVAALDESVKTGISTHSYGLPESDEVRLAVRVAETAGVPSFVYPLNAPDYVDYAGAMPDALDELDIFVQAAQIKFLREAKSRIDVLMTGIDLDVTLGGIYLEPEIMTAGSLEEIFAQIKRKNVVFSEPDLKAVLRPGLWELSVDSVYPMAYRLLKDLPQENPAASYDLFINQYSMRRIIMLRYAMNRLYLETASPMYDYDFIDLVRALPLNQRAKHASFIPFLEALSAPLSQITYQRTMLPANAPRHFWKESEEIERLREQLYLKIWRETNGQVSIPYRRYYTNYDEWLRIDPAWRQLTDRLLGDASARLYQMEIASPAAVGELIRQHRTGERSHRQRLIILMSLELFLRKHFEMETQ